MNNRQLLKILWEKEKLLEQPMAFGNIVGKGEIACHKQFLLFLQCFQLNQKIVSSFVHIFDILSLFAAHSKDPKMGISGKGLKGHYIIISLTDLLSPLYYIQYFKLYSRIFTMKGYCYVIKRAHRTIQYYFNVYICIIYYMF